MSDFIPKFISSYEGLSSGHVITADYWNQVFNLLREQGDYNSETLNSAINDAAWNLGFFIKDSDDVTIGRKKYLKFANSEIAVDSENDVITVQGLTGPQGIQGERGLATPGIQILGMLADEATLLSTYPVGEEGDAWAIGDTESNVLYVWDYVAEAWVNIGSVQGLQGPQGVTGEGVPAGGTAGQFLSKIDGVDFNTQWASLPSEVAYLSGVTSAIQTQINSKEPTITVTASRALVSDASGKLAISAATSNEVGYLSGVTSGIQAQINGKLGATSTAVNSTKWAGRQCFVSSTTPSGGVSGDIWFQI